MAKKKIRKETLTLRNGEVIQAGKEYTYNNETIKVLYIGEDKIFVARANGYEQAVFLTRLRNGINSSL